ncbi:MAG: helix-turn-helix domain-containing protein [Phycisphaerae bacterium]|nr:helix-turn-helix domain-containing protein [Phycisphaerae bacterium]
MDPYQFQKDFFGQIDEISGAVRLFDYLPEIHLFIKNQHSQFVKVSQANLNLLGAKSESEVIGKTDRDFFTKDIADKYIEEDRQVMAQHGPFINKIWLVPSDNGLLNWYLCTKIPLFNKQGQVTGLAGTLRDYKTAGAVLEPYNRIADVIKYINDNYHQTIKITDLAELAHLSVSQFERTFKKLFHTSPLKYIIKARLKYACQSLSQTNETITHIALKTGFYDHSYFTKIFTRYIGIKPGQYREQYYKNNHSHPI